MKTVKKRANGEGSYIWQHGKLYYKVKVGEWPDGRARYRKFPGSTEQEAFAAYETYVYSHRNPNYEEQITMTFGDYMALWMKSEKLNRVEGSTYDSIEDALLRVNKFPFGHTPLKKLTPDALTAMLKSMASDGEYGHSTAVKTLMYIKQCIRFAEKNKLLEHNFLDDIKVPPKNSFVKGGKDIEHYSTEDYEMLKEQALKKYSTGKFVFRYGPAFLFMMATGLRPGELRAAQWGDIENVPFQGRTIQEIHVRHAMSEYVDREWEEKTGERRLVEERKEPKTEGSKRDIPLTPAAEEYLEYLRGLCGGHTGPGDYIVQNERHGPVNRGNFERFYRSLAKRAGIVGDGALNRARHHFAASLVLQKQPVNIAQKALGHSNPQTTLKYYAKATNYDLQAALLGDKKDE